MNATSASPRQTSAGVDGRPDRAPLVALEDLSGVERHAGVKLYEAAQALARAVEDFARQERSVGEITRMHADYVTTGTDLDEDKVGDALRELIGFFATAGVSSACQMVLGSGQPGGQQLYEALAEAEAVANRLRDEP